MINLDRIINWLHVNISDIFLWKIITLPKLKKKLEWWQDFTFLQIFLMRLIEDSCIFICGFAFNLLWYVVLVAVYEENLASHWYVLATEIFHKPFQIIVNILLWYCYGLNSVSPQKGSPNSQDFRMLTLLGNKFSTDFIKFRWGH